MTHRSFKWGDTIITDSNLLLLYAQGEEGWNTCNLSISYLYFATTRITILLMIWWLIDSSLKLYFYIYTLKIIFKEKDRIDTMDLNYDLKLIILFFALFN